MDTPPITVPNIQKEQSQMVHSNFVRCSDGSRNSSKRKVVLKSDCDLDFLSDDVLNEILIRIPARDILDATMLVCRKWNQMTHTHSFVSAHLRHSTHGLLISNSDNQETYFLLLTRSGEIEVSKFRYKFRNRVWSSCNGLVLQSKFDDDYEVVTGTLSSLLPTGRYRVIYSVKLGYKLSMMFQHGSFPCSRWTTIVTLISNIRTALCGC